jgi:putative redox protein
MGRRERRGDGHAPRWSIPALAGHADLAPARHRRYDQAQAAARRCGVVMLESKDAVLVSETGGGKFQVRVRTGDHDFIADEPLAYGGLSSGPNPFDLLGAALGACTVMTMRLYAARKGWSVGPLSVHVTHHKSAPQGRDRFERILHLGEVTQEQQDLLQGIAARCPVHLLLERGADVSTTVAAAELADGAAEGLHAQLIDALCDEAA